MEEASRFHTNHKDYVHDMQFDYYGRRLATCSADMTIKVWDMDEEGEWKINPGCEWKAHHGMVWKLDWAHPEFGQVLASCSSDHNVQIWEEQEGVLEGDSQASPGSRWHPKAQLTDSRKWVQDLKFSPRHLGLRLATASADGKIRIYEAIDVMNLSHWSLQKEISDVDSGELGVTCLSWNKCQFEAPMLASGGDSGAVKIWRYENDSRDWQLLMELESHKDAVLDIDWAPNIGRSYHLLATAGKDSELRVYKLRRSDGSSVEYEKMVLQVTSESEVWRVRWNVTGTVLASSGDDGKVQMWRSDYQGCWRCISEVKGNLLESEHEDEEMNM
mmetsp:Transcript_12233/g.16045  ORF Transcript_12233/g.16045 Transcript_12233/m.16045 type:complete len:330 (+) Transcript_12233:118-1107(+)